VIIGVYNKKGGVGKTTMAFNLAATLKNVEPERDIIAIDTDEQKTLKKIIVVREEYCANNNKINLRCVVEDEYQRNFHKQILSYKTDDNILVIDSGGRDTNILRSLLPITNIVIVPLAASPFDLWSTDEFIDTLIQLKSLNPNQKVLFLPYKIKGNESIYYDLVDQLKGFKKEYELDYFSSIISDRTDYKVASTLGMTVLEYEAMKGHDDWRLKKEFESFYNELMKKIEDFSKS
jgi:chromosome partitioning protein